MMRDDWARKQVEALQQKPTVEVGRGIVSVPECLKLIRRAQARERAAWRKAIKEAATEERERCAKVAEAWPNIPTYESRQIAAAIRQEQDRT